MIHIYDNNNPICNRQMIMSYKHETIYIYFLFLWYSTRISSIVGSVAAHFEVCSLIHGALLLRLLCPASSGCPAAPRRRTTNIIHSGGAGNYKAIRYSQSMSAINPMEIPRLCGLNMLKSPFSNGFPIVVPWFLSPAQPDSPDSLDSLRRHDATGPLRRLPASPPPPWSLRRGRPDDDVFRWDHRLGQYYMFIMFIVCS